MTDAEKIAIPMKIIHGQWNTVKDKESTMLEKMIKRVNLEEQRSTFGAQQTQTTPSDNPKESCDNVRHNTSEDSK